ncbi:NAP1-related protein 2 [Striga hermonthica]|uniref:NAP1-related protein 2 n=1 Tax=Striga hermonthica TaxID=68872 RepID=A0A9N7R5N5_STRHE|nr:NAP1-related protein 2 [Striga hermonthica]
MHFHIILLRRQPIPRTEEHSKNLDGVRREDLTPSQHNPECPLPGQVRVHSFSTQQTTTSFSHHIISFGGVVGDRGRGRGRGRRGQGVEEEVDDPNLHICLPTGPGTLGLKLKLSRTSGIPYTVLEKLVKRYWKVEQKYNEVRKPVYDKRNNVIKSIHDHWLTAFKSHPALSELLTDEDQKIFKYLSNLRSGGLQRCDTFQFKPNPYFEDTKLTKTFAFRHNRINTKAMKKLIYLLA